ncbi:hypothetical protein [Vampirovibrio chlorellavorus]|uniref:hypothetical protein n=1 Tax=Vampirovibrio chlorellavorus TaxID=758823 RepID=UPI0026EB988D|nr:hypothetical protein [Vampirovibrio chlorellavorus]
MMDAMNQLKLPKYQALKNQTLAKSAAQPASTPIAFGQKTQPIHRQNGHQGDVFIKSTPAVSNASKPASLPPRQGNPVVGALQTFVKQAVTGNNPWLNALQKLSPLMEAIPSASKMPNPQALGPANSPVNTRNKATLFAGAALTGAGLGALSGLVLGPAALAANPALLNKAVALLPTQLP